VLPAGSDSRHRLITCLAITAGTAEFYQVGRDHRSISLCRHGLQWLTNVSRPALPSTTANTNNLSSNQRVVIDSRY
jgi:hypothetical protein